jgi:3-oxoacyl-[acyl-carrier protein] reductase
MAGAFVCEVFCKMAKTVLITGASRGIGRETALQFARAGYRVAANYHARKDAAKSLLSELAALGCDAAVYQADVSDRAAVEAMVQKATVDFGHIDLLVNNAGIAQQKLFTDLTASEWERMFAVNVTGMFHTCQCVLPQMIRRHEGRIVNLSSMWGIAGASCEVHYSAAKSAVIGFTKALAKEVGPSGITVNCVAPGLIATEMNAQLDAAALEALREETPLGKVGTPADVASLICYLCSDAAGFLTGQVISPNGGFVI